MSALTIKKIPPMAKDRPLCENGCKSSMDATLAASHRLELMGRPWFVCNRCAKTLTRVWNENVSQALEQAA